LGQENNEEEVVTAADQLIERDRVRGVEQGARQILLMLIERRFGTLPEEAFERVIAAKLETLETWGLRVLTATTLQDVLGEE
jgi:hypothetical protein